MKQLQQSRNNNPTVNQIDSNCISPHFADRKVFCRTAAQLSVSISSCCIRVFLCICSFTNLSYANLRLEIMDNNIDNLIMNPEEQTFGKPKNAFIAFFSQNPSQLQWQKM